MSVEPELVQLSLPEETNPEAPKKVGTWIKKPPFGSDESDYDLRRRLQNKQQEVNGGNGQPEDDSDGASPKRARPRNRGRVSFHPIDGSSGMRDENRRAAIVAGLKR